ncbi:MAG: c-type cytochrome biogenesis protein CcmI [Gammaproteobacteria bacterium]|nr:c-type cytochrome biogenesis protein CcmI [Gammaproteobacteria bacterium]
MNVTFWGALLAMLLVAIAILVLPLLKVRKTQSIASKASNIQLHAEKLKELDVDLQEGRIDQADYKIARQELDRELLEDIPAESEEIAAMHYTAEAKKRPALALFIAILLPALSLLIYQQLGTRADTEQEVAAVEEKLPSIAEMVVQLEQYLQDNKGELKDWVKLGRTY